MNAYSVIGTALTILGGLSVFHLGSCWISFELEKRIGWDWIKSYSLIIATVALISGITLLHLNKP